MNDQNIGFIKTVIINLCFKILGEDVISPSIAVLKHVSPELPKIPQHYKI
jgi:hypothetical protein